MLLGTIAAIFGLVGITNGGYIYPRPNITLKLPKIKANFEEEIYQKSLREFLPRQTVQSVVSYSVPGQNYYDLHQHNHNLLNADAHSSNIIRDITVDPLATDILELDKPNLNAPASILENNLGLATQQHIVQQDGNSDFNTPVNIHKHMYFHVPPPEIEEPSAREITPKIKKDYKIIFIKVPSQERKDIDQLQRNSINQPAPFDEKTIIYVLYKKPTTEQVVSPKPVASQHEVFYVNYNGNVGTAVKQISDNLDQLDL